MNTSSIPLSTEESPAWNEAHDRLRHFFETFALADKAQVSRLTLKVLDRTRELHRDDPSRHPATLAMEQAQKLVGEWLATHLETQNKPLPYIFASGYMALFLSRIFQKAPTTFLTSHLPENLSQEMRQALLVIGPDLQISSMTPRHLDFGPMRDLARETWHRWNSREILIALLFWAGIYYVFYGWLSDLL